MSNCIKGLIKVLIELKRGRLGSDSFKLALIERRSSSDKPSDIRGQAGDLNM
jgi:hypothetical protein